MRDRRRRQTGRRLAPSVQRLRDQGKRTRYEIAFGLSERDRVAAQYVDSFDGNLQEVLKQYLYDLATGQQRSDLGDQIAYLTDMVEELQAKLRHGVIPVQEKPPENDDDQVRRAQAALSKFMTK